ncbi:MAG: DUF5696 domain-containing protein [Saccharofermentanales bacterium]
MKKNDRKKTKKIKAYALMIAIAMLAVPLLAGCSGRIEPEDTSELKNEYNNEDIIYNAGIKSTGGMSLITETAQAQLYVNGQTTEIAVKDKRTGVMWYSNPSDRATDTIAAGTNAQELNSQIKIEYYDPQNTKAFLNSSNDSVALDQFKFFKIPGGVRVNYGIGFKPKIYNVPIIMSVPRYTLVKSKLNADDQAELDGLYTFFSLKDIESETDRAFYTNAFPITKTRDIYYLSSINIAIPRFENLSDYMLSKAQKVLDKAGYTEADFNFDSADNKMILPRPKSNYMDLAIEYTLDGADLIAKVPAKSIKYDSKEMNVTRISVLPFFGAAGKDKEGYIFVPDGSGALISLNNGKANHNSYLAPVYGRDHSIPVTRLTRSEESHIYLPVFGLKQEEDAFFAVIEKGDAAADIELRTSGQINSYNNIYPTFNFKYAAVETRFTLNIAGLLNFQKKSLQSDLQIRYMFLQGEEADYTGMAHRYQKYMLDSKQMSRQEFKATLPVNVNLIGAIPNIRSVAGIPVKSQKPVTTFRQAVDLLKELKTSGFGDIYLQYTYWCNNGILNTTSDKIDIINALGSRSDFNSLIEYTKMSGIGFYPNLNFIYTTGGAFYGLFTEKSQAARDLGSSVVHDFKYNTATLNYIPDGTNTIISPNRYGGIFDKFVKKYNRYEIEGLSLGVMGEDLNSDYNKNAIIDRQMTKDEILKQLDRLKASIGSLTFDGANAYLLKNAALINSMPAESGNYYMFDRSVPFYQIVLHGIIPYSSEPLNLAGDYETAGLKLIETGTIPSFEWMYEHNTEIKETEADFFALNYNDWLGWAKEYYKEISAALEGCQTSSITSHEMLAEKVYMTVYGNGTKVIVNYNTVAYEKEGITVEPMDYTVIREEG